MRVSYQHTAHPHIKQRASDGPAKASAHKRGEKLDTNAKIAIGLTKAVGTMWCAYVFCGLALFALPDAIKSGSVVTIVQWISQTFIQLVMLSVIMVGQNILGQAADKRAEMTYKDADATFHEACEIQKHLLEQDDAINAILDRMEVLAAKLEAQS